MVVLPFGFLISVLFVFYRMEGDNELVILKATGFSNLNLIRPIIYSACILFVVLGVLTTIIAPKTNQIFVRTYHDLRNSTPSFYIQDRQFINFDKLTVYIRHAQKDEKLQGLLIHDTRGGSSTITAREGHFVRKGERLQMTLYDGVRYEKNTQSSKPALLTFEKYDVIVNDQTATKDSLKVNVHSQTTRDLLKYPPHLRTYFSQKQAYAELHKRFLFPFLIILFGLFAGATMLLGQNRRGQRYGKAFVAVMLSVVTQVMLVTILGIAKRYIWVGFMGYALVSALIILTVITLSSPLRLWSQKRWLQYLLAKGWRR